MQTLKKVASEWFRQIYYYGLGATRLDDDVEEYSLSNWYDSYLLPMTKFLAVEPFQEEPFSTQAAEKLLHNTPLVGDLESADAYLRKCCGTMWYYVLPLVSSKIGNLPETAQERLKLFISVFNAIKDDYDSAVVSFDVNYADTEILVNRLTQKPAGLYPQACVVYPEVWCIRAGGRELNRLNKASYASLNKAQIQFLKDAVVEGILPKEDLAEFKILVPISKGVVDYVSYNILSDNLPPADLLQALQLVPDSLITRYGDQYKALYYLAHNDTLGDYITEDVLDYLDSIAWYFEDDVEESQEAIVETSTGFMNPCVAETAAYAKESCDESEVLSLLTAECNSSDDLMGVVASYPEMAYKIISGWRDAVLNPPPAPEPVVEIKEVEKTVYVDPIEEGNVMTKASYLLWHAIRKAYESDDSSTNHDKWLNATRCLFRITQGRYMDVESTLKFFDGYAEASDSDVKVAILEAREIIACDNPGLH